MATRHISVSELKWACLDAAWRKAWVDGETLFPATVHDTLFHQIVEAYIARMIAEDAAETVVDSSDAIWHDLYDHTAMPILNELFESGSYAQAASLTKQLEAFCHRLLSLKRDCPHFSSWRDVYVAKAYSLQEVPLRSGNNTLLVSAPADALRFHPEGGIEIVDYKLSKSVNPHKEMLTLAIYAKLLQTVSADTCVEGVMEYYTPDVEIETLSAQQLHTIYEEMVEPVIALLFATEDASFSRSVLWEQVVPEISSKKMLIVPVGSLVFPIGVDTSGRSVNADLNQTSHLLVAGETRGIYNFLRVFIASLLYQNSIETLQLTMIGTETFASFATLPHLTEPVVTQEALLCLKTVEDEMLIRHQILFEEDYQTLSQRIDDDKKGIAYRVVIIDEFTELMRSEGGKMRRVIANLMQNGAAVGIHIVIATKHPQEALSEWLKDEFSLKVCLKVATIEDSEAVLNESGGENLPDGGTLLYTMGRGVERVQTIYVHDDTLQKLLEQIR